jgi:hypothetical protein
MDSDIVNFISLFPKEHIRIVEQSDREHILPRSLPDRLIFTTNSSVPDLEFNDPNSLIIRNSSGYVSGINEVDFLQKNRNIIETNIIFDKKKIFDLIDNFTTSAIYSQLLILYNKITSDNFILKIEDNVCNLYCDSVKLIVLNHAHLNLNHYIQLHFSDPSNNNFRVFVEYVPMIKNFIISAFPIIFNREKILEFSLYLFYDNIFVSVNENIARISLMDMDLFVRNYYLELIRTLMLEPRQNDFLSKSENYYQNNVVTFYNIFDVLIRT